MSDVFSKQKRSEVMARIRSRGNKETELALVRLFREQKITGWRRHVEIRGGAAAPRSPNITAPRQQRPTFRVRPDFVWRGARLALLVDGCFWHGCPKHSNLPVQNRPFWERKLAANKARDRLVNRTLKQHGWRVLRIWEHSLRNPGRVARRVKRLLESAARPGD